MKTGKPIIYTSPELEQLRQLVAGARGATGGIGNGLHQGEIARGRRASRVIPTFA